MPRRRDRLPAVRFAERRRREDEAPRLSDQVPALAELRLEIEERDGAGSTRYVRHFAVDRAPALFLVPCGDPRCSGEHDLTSAVMGGLRAGETMLHGGEACRGSVGSAPCSRVLAFRGAAEYRTPWHVPSEEIPAPAMQSGDA